ncbi:MAG TPA: prenyltransferase/squalene oxidase repeat-containing protein [Pseudonocardiaceae bacterium]|nr:prenyltransferase/squalene oxidase repeat-containing protein [Pseudonocardiaceae bacterium]
MTGSASDRLDQAIDAAVAGLTAIRRADGSWPGRLSPAATATGAAVIALRLADPVGSTDLVDAAVDWLRRSQDPSGGWGEDVGEPATLNATSIAVAALAFAAPDRAAREIELGQRKLAELGGREALGDRARCSLSAVCLRFMAVAGLHDENALSRVPLELALLPRKLRSKLSFTVPGMMAWGVMDRHRRPARGLTGLLRRLGEPRAMAYLDELVAFEGPNGGFEESPLMSSCVAFGLHRAGVREDIVRHCLNYLRTTQKADGSWSVNRDLEIPITAYVAIGVQDACGDPLAEQTVAWFRERQREGMPMVTGCPAGGWGWAYPSGWPNTGDATATMLALGRYGLPPDDPAIQGGVGWLTAMQNKDGSWGCFSKDAKITLDAPCSVMSADAVSTLHDVGGLAVDHPVIQRAVAWFAKSQRADGALACRWYVGLTAGTAGTLRVLTELGLGTSPTATRARDWLLAARNDDGGWGPDAGSPSCPELTAWAMLALLADPHSDEDILASAAAYLMSAQRAEDGLWTPVVFGIYFLDVLYASDHHANGHALQALARYRDRCGARVGAELSELPASP